MLITEYFDPMKVSSILFLGLLLISTHKVDAQNQRALLIGINTYITDSEQVDQFNTLTSTPNRGHHTRAWRNLRGAINDVEMMRNIIVSRYGFQPDHITTLIDHEATREGILNTMEEVLVKQTVPGDEIFFFYAGHGSQVLNSLSNEPNLLDETIVPVDANLGVPDIRDKELREIFNKSIDAGGRLTLIFDSCHSGSIARGVFNDVIDRKIEPVLHDIADDSLNDLPAPENRGALVISSAADFQTAGERRNRDGMFHGIFTDALSQILLSAPVDEPAEYLFSRVRAIIKSDGRFQDPVLTGNAERRNSPLFNYTGGNSGVLRIPVLRVETSSRILLQAGLSIGLYTGSELIESLSGTTIHEPIRLRVTQSDDISTTLAEIIEGDASRIEPGMTFEVTKATYPQSESLSIWYSVISKSVDSLRYFAQNVHDLIIETGFDWVSDPTKFENINDLIVLIWNGSEWNLLINGNKFANLGQELKFFELRNTLEELPISDSFFLMLPMSKYWLADNRPAYYGMQSALRRVDCKTQADYLLIGRFDTQEYNDISYSWISPVIEPKTEPSSVLPSRSDWVSIKSESALVTLQEHASRIARVNGWLKLNSPPSSNSFPYRLAVRNATSGEFRHEGHLDTGESYGLVMYADSSQITPLITSRYVYVFIINSSGQSILMFPLGGNVENRIPFQVAGQREFQDIIPLGNSNLLSIEDEYDVNVIFAITTEEQIGNPWILDSDAISTRSIERAGIHDPLERLLFDRNQTTRGASRHVPITWSIQKLFFTSGKIEDK